MDSAETNNAFPNPGASNNILVRLAPESGARSNISRHQEKLLREFVEYSPPTGKATRLHALLELQSLERRLASIPAEGSDAGREAAWPAIEKRREAIERWLLERDSDDGASAPPQEKFGDADTEPGSKAALAERLSAKREAVGKGQLGLRWRRCTSWFERAEQELDEGRFDAAFIFLWIAFKAAYSEDTFNNAESWELDSIRKYIAKLISYDTGKLIGDAVWSRAWPEIVPLLNNEYIFAPFWESRHHNPGQTAWQDRFKSSNESVSKARIHRDTPQLLRELFERLYVLRNQLIHGGATYKGSVNREQVEHGAAVMRLLLPVFLELMFDNPGGDWGNPKYPVVNSGGWQQRPSR